MKLVKLFAESVSPADYRFEPANLPVSEGSSRHPHGGPASWWKEGDDRDLNYGMFLFTILFSQCGHLGGKVLVPTSTHVSRLIASRFQLDMLHSTMLLIARSDAESGKLISSTVDANDHEFIIGTTTPGTALADEIAEAEMKGASGAEIEKLETKWMAEHEMCTFNQGELVEFCRVQRIIISMTFPAVEKAINASSNIKDKPETLKQYLAAVDGKSNSHAREIAKDFVGQDVFWNWDSEYSHMVYSIHV